MRINTVLLAVALLVASYSLIVTSCCAQSPDSITITTYYPSPYGSYNEMSVASRMAIGNVDGSADGLVNSSDMAVDSSGNPIAGSLTVANRIGIGTTRPAYQLDINSSTSQSSLHIRTTNTQGNSAVVFGNDTSTDPAAIFLGSSLNTNFPNRLVLANGIGDITFNGASTFANPTGEYMRINSTGNVGIGTTSPGAKLEVAGGIKLANDTASCNANKAGTMRYNADRIEYCSYDGTAPLGSWQAVGSGGISYIYYCFSNSTYGTPVCPATVTIGTQGPCSAGFIVRRALGSWGDCNACKKTGTSQLGNYFLPPGGTCGTNCLASWTTILGQAYVCSQ